MRSESVLNRCENRGVLVFTLGAYAGSTDTSEARTRGARFRAGFQLVFVCICVRSRFIRAIFACEYQQ
jgi:hypothetical protein